MAFGGGAGCGRGLPPPAVKSAHRHLLTQLSHMQPGGFHMFKGEHKAVEKVGGCGSTGDRAVEDSEE